MKITIGIPVFNRKTNIASCINSVLNQKIISEVDFSVLIVDNNSDDGTREVLKTFETNPLVEIIYNDKNIGMAGNWTKVFKSSNADYTFLLQVSQLKSSSATK